MTYKRVYLAAAVVWTITTGVLCLLPGKDLPSVKIVNFDKVAHLGAFGLLNLLFLCWDSLRIERRPILITCACIAYSGILELLQGQFYTDRYSDPADFAANAIGCVLAYGFIRLRKV